MSTPNPTPEQQQMFDQMRSALGVAESKQQAAKQMIDELTNANVHLRAGLFEMEKQLREAAQQQMATDKKVSDLEAKITKLQPPAPSSIPVPETSPAPVA